MANLAMEKGRVYMDTSYNIYYPEGASLLDGLPEDLAEVTPEYWRDFPPQHPLIVHFCAIAFFVLWCLNAGGNMLVMYIFMTVKRLRSPTNMLVVNLAFSDFCMMTSMGLSVSINAMFSDHWIWGVALCKVYGSVGAVFGTASLATMVVIGWDRYNVIVKGMAGKRLTPCKAMLIISIIWIYCILGAIPPFLGWGGYALDGLLITCNYDFYNKDWNRLSYGIYAFVMHYCLPLLCTIFFYSSIVKAVVAHEAALKKQAKKMNVDSLRSNADANAESAEIRIAKVAITNVSLWFVAWTPFAFICMMCVLGQWSLVTPLSSQLPSFFAKTASCINPIVFAMSHPKYREALTEKVPCLGIREYAPKEKEETQMVSTTA